MFSDLNLIIKYALRDLSRSYKKIISIIFTLFISLFILSSILTIEDSLKKELDNNAKILLGGDIEIDYNRIKGNDNLIDKINQFSTVSQIVEFSTMISKIEENQNKSLFARVKTIDKNYPLYGEVIYEPINALEKIKNQKNTILVNKNIFKSLGLKLNDNIKIQNRNFKVVGIVNSLPDIGGAFVFGDFALAGKYTLDDLDLNNLGSFLNYEYKLKFNQKINEIEGTKKVEELFKNEKRAKLRYPKNSASGLKRIIDNFSQFLSLVSISAMLIAGIGVANTLLSFINQKSYSIATQKAIGILSSNIKIIYYFQLFILLIFISIFSYLLSFLMIPFVDNLISDGLGFNIKAYFSFTNYIKIFSVGLLVVIIFAIPTINSIDEIKASNLFRNVFQNLQFKYNYKSITLSVILVICLISLFTFGNYRPLYSIIYFIAFFLCLLIFYLISTFAIKILKKTNINSNISLKIAVKNITQKRSITHITVISLGIGITLLLSLAFVGSNFKREIAKSIPEISPDYFFLGIQNNQKEKFENLIYEFDKNANIEVVPMVSAELVKINGNDPHSFIDQTNDSYWVIQNDRRVSWMNQIPENNPLTQGSWWDLSKPDKLQISLDDKVAKDFNINLGDKFTLNIYGREIEGEIINFRFVDYRDLSINFAMLLNPQFARNIPHEYLSTVKFDYIQNFNEVKLLEIFPSISIINISDYLFKVTDVLNKVFIAVSVISTITVIIGLVVISSAIIVQGKIKIFQNLVFKILGFSKSEIAISSIFEFLLTFISIIFMSLIFAIISSKYVIEKIFQLQWKFDFQIFFNVSVGVGLVALILILLTNLKYLNPKIYPLIRNE